MAEIDCKSYHHLRSDVRFPTDFRAVLRWGDNSSCVRVANIARSGMRFIGRALPERGDKVRVVANGLDVGGQVVWQTAHSCAVILEQIIDPLAVVRANCFARHLVVADRPSLDQVRPTATSHKLASRLPAASRSLAPRTGPVAWAPIDHRRQPVEMRTA